MEVLRTEFSKKYFYDELAPYISSESSKICLKKYAS